MGLLGGAKTVFSKLYNKLFKASMAKMSYSERKRIIDSFDEPQDRLQRSFFQYSCHGYGVSKFLQITQNIVSFIPLKVLLFKSGANKEYQKKDNTAVYISDGIDTSIIPDSVKAKYKNINELTYNGKICLGKKEKQFYKEYIKPYAKNRFFALKIYAKIGLYANFIREYSPKAIIVYNEYSFTSSALTQYCECLGIKHINIMHGEKIYNIRDSFVSYHSFYVWDEYYKDICLAMRCDKDQFTVELPATFLEKHSKLETKFDIKYYLGDESEEQLEILKTNLLKLQNLGNNICVRMHPRFSDRKLVQRIFNEFSLENPDDIDIKTSILQGRNISAQSSTVLYQAFLMEKNIVIDDMTNTEKFNIYKDLGYILLTKKHKLLSEYIHK